MNTIRLIRASAIATTALALTVAGTSMASADESGPGTARLSSHSTSAKAGVPAALVSSTKVDAAARSGARAAAVPVDLYGVRTTNLVVNSKVEYAQTRFSGKVTGAFDTISIKARLYHGSRYIKSVSLGNRLGGTISFGTSYGRGTFRVGGFDLTWTRGGTTYKGYDASYGYFSAKSAISGGFKNGNVFRIKRHGSKKVVKVKAKYYSTSGWRAYRTTTKFQQKKHGWHTKKKLKLNKSGKAKYTYYDGARRKYRVTFKSHATIVGGKSQVIKI